MDGDEDNLSNVSLVSTISAASSTHQPHPPDGPKPATRGFRARKSKVVRSPYLVTSTPYHPPPRQKRSNASVSFHPKALRSKSTPSIARDRWVTAVKSSGYAPECWSSPSVHSSASFLNSLMKTPSFSAVVTASMAKKKKGSEGRSRSQPSPDPIALQDEILELKKEVNAVSRERDLERAQRRRLEVEVGKKDKHIEDLLSSGHITAHDATRSLTSSRRDPNNTVISSLRQQLHTLERALREKESAYTALQRDMKATRLKELELEGETYYQEVCRLRALLDQRGSPRSVRESQTKLRALNDAVVKLSSRLEQTENENKQLKEEMKRLHCECPHMDSLAHNEQGLRGSIADKYADYKRSEMLSAVVDLELKLQEKERTLQSLCREFDQKKAHYESRIGALTGNHSDAMEQVKLLEGRLTEAESSREKLRNIIRKLKEDRTHYRSLAERTQVELESMRDRVQHEEVGRADLIRELDALRELHQSEVTAREHAHKLAKRKSRMFAPDKERREAAAIILQQQWRKRKAIKRQEKFQESMEQTAIDIQRALRGHLTRKKLLDTPSPSPSSSPPLTPSQVKNDSSDTVAIETIQSALRGHLARHTILKESVSVCSLEGRDAKSLAWRRDRAPTEKVPYSYLSEHSGDHTPHRQDSSGSNMDHADVESLADEQVTPSCPSMLSSNDCEAPDTRTDDALLTDELL